MVSDQLVSKVAEYAAKHGIHIQQYNVRAWGSYEPVLSFDGHHWFHPGQLFGWGWTLPQAMAETFDRIIEESILKQWLGDVRHAELQEIVYSSRTSTPPSNSITPI